MATEQVTTREARQTVLVDTFTRTGCWDPTSDARAGREWRPYRLELNPAALGPIDHALDPRGGHEVSQLVAVEGPSRATRSRSAIMDIRRSPRSPPRPATTSRWRALQTPTRIPRRRCARAAAPSGPRRAWRASAPSPCAAPVSAADATPFTTSQLHDRVRRPPQRRRDGILARRRRFAREAALAALPDNSVQNPDPRRPRTHRGPHPTLLRPFLGPDRHPPRHRTRSPTPPTPAPARSSWALRRLRDAITPTRARAAQDRRTPWTWTQYARARS